MMCGFDWVVCAANRLKLTKVWIFCSMRQKPSQQQMLQEFGLIFRHKLSASDVPTGFINYWYYHSGIVFPWSISSILSYFWKYAFGANIGGYNPPPPLEFHQDLWHLISRDPNYYAQLCCACCVIAVLYSEGGHQHRRSRPSLALRQWPTDVLPPASEKIWSHPAVFHMTDF